MEKIIITARLSGYDGATRSFVIEKKLVDEIAKKNSLDPLAKRISNKLRKRIRFLEYEGGNLLVTDLHHDNSPLWITCYENDPGIEIRESVERRENRAIVNTRISKSYLVPEAIKQLTEVSRYPGMRYVVGLPDLHPGPNIPIGCAFVSEEWIFPSLIGNDIGCGMALVQTRINARRLSKKRDNIATRLDLGDGDQIPVEEREGFLQRKIKNWIPELKGINKSILDGYGYTGYGLGSIGGGNHFVELLVIDEVYNKKIVDENKLDMDAVYILIHTGSRGLGSFFLEKTRDRVKDLNSGITGADRDDYLRVHNEILVWAGYNRYALLERTLEQLGETEYRCVVDIMHNMIEEKDGYYIHRKGATPINDNLSIVAGSRGSYTYLVSPCSGSLENAYSLPHGAGRKWSRRKSKQLFREVHYRSEDDKNLSGLGSRVVSRDKRTLMEESEDAYKNIDDVMSDLAEYRMAEKIARLRPVITLK